MDTPHHFLKVFLPQWCLFLCVNDHRLIIHLFYLQCSHLLVDIKIAITEILIPIMAIIIIIFNFLLLLFQFLNAEVHLTFKKYRAYLHPFTLTTFAYCISYKHIIEKLFKSINIILCKKSMLPPNIAR